MSLMAIFQQLEAITLNYHGIAAVCLNILRLSGVNDRGLVIASPIVDVELGWLPSSDRFGGIVNFELARAYAGCILFSGKNDKVTKSPYGTDLSEVA
jgi:hypothetical protein